MSNTPTNLVETVREKYGAVAQAFGYSTSELTSIPAQANMGLSCGNPTAFASLRPGEVVVDLGCGGGLDVFLAGQKVGPAGKAIGIDMTPAMIDLANRNKAQAGPAADNVEFYAGMIHNLPLPAQSADVIISNCVINLAPNKNAVFREMFRILKPGGRVAVSDIALKNPSPELATDIMAYVGCIAGAIEIEAYQRGLAQAGFADVVVTDTGADLNAYANVEGQGACCSPVMTPPATGVGLPIINDAPFTPPASVHAGLSDLLRRYNVNDYAASVKIHALKE